MLFIFIVDFYYEEIITPLWVLSTNLTSAIFAQVLMKNNNYNKSAMLDYKELKEAAYQSTDGSNFFTFMTVMINIIYIL